MKNAYDVSVVTAVYNAAPFLGETVESLLGQDFGFSRVQLILVDDGSTDGSGALCDAYAKQYPENVEVVHKPNGGVSSARNEGLKRVRGKYVSFLDADDLLDKNALSKVFAFFEAHPETDVVSLPMEFFDAATGPHLLNFKYEKGSRVIDLNREPRNPQLAVTSAFVRAAALRDKSFDEQLKYAEDAKFLQSILIEKKTLGVVSGAVHRYRRRSQGEASAIQLSKQSPAWYHPYLKGFCLDTIRMCIEREGSVPVFVQHTIAYDLQWRICEHTPSSLFGAEEKASYKALLREVFPYLDDDVIAAQTELQPYQIGFALALKHGTVPDAYRELCRGPLQYAFFTVRDGLVTLECTSLLLPGETTPPKFVLEANGARVEGACEDLRHALVLLDEPAAQEFHYTFRVPLPDDKTPLALQVLRVSDSGEEPVRSVACGQHFPLSELYATAYARIGQRMLTLENGALTLSKRTRRRFVREVKFLKELWTKNIPGGRKAVAGRLVYAVCKPLQRKPVWLLSDRTFSAGDNGEALFRYLCSRKKKPARLIFSVSARSKAYAELKKIGRVVPAMSFRHKLLYLLSDLNISSHADNDVITPFSHWNTPYRDIEQRIPFIFLQHGVIKDDLSDWLNRFRCNAAGFVTSAKPEADSIRECAYGYVDDVIWLTGLPRFDRLYHDEKRCVTVMPTWRHMWVLSSNPKTGVRDLKEGFEQGAFFRFFNALLNDPRLLDAAKRNGYRIRFLPHPLLQPHVGRFTRNDAVDFLSPDTPYRQVFAESDLILTDYSSVAFDFAYLRKPILYTQFDRDTFFSGEHAYVKGYFDYERDGFGEVETEYEATVDRLIEYMENCCRLKDAYRARIDGFFAFDDRENCRRVFEKILALREKQK